MLGASICMKKIVAPKMASFACKERELSGDVAGVWLPEKTRNSRVLVLGGTGRVGGSTAVALSKLCPELRIVVCGRNRERGSAMVEKLGEKAEFAEVDIHNEKLLEATLSDVDLVIHAAGPFQQFGKCSVLEAAIQTKTAYLDVCDDKRYATRARLLNSIAVAANVPAITTAGIAPGVSNVMAAELIRAARIGKQGEPESLGFSYFTAGTGGSGPGVLASSFFLLGQEVVAFHKGGKIKLRPYSGMLQVDFGEGIGKKDVYLWDLPEVTSAHEVLGVPSVSARFGTSPSFWNWAMEGIATLLPPNLSIDTSTVQWFFRLLHPVIRAIDVITGEDFSLRVDLECTDGSRAIGILSHKTFSVCAGKAAAAFAIAVLEASTKPGVWFPEEPEGIAVEAREVLLKRAAQGTINFTLTN